MEKLTNIGDQHRIVLYPTVGHYVRKREAWRIPILGIVYEADRISPPKHWILRMMQRLNRVHPTPEQQAVFDSRIAEFIAPTERGIQLAVRIGQDIVLLPETTRRSGRLNCNLWLSNAEMDALRASGAIHNGRLDLNVVRSTGESSGFVGEVHVITDTGLSVISDIDDTLKVTAVTNRREIIENTFLREFRAVEGMAKVYQQWAKQGATFHYVSSSPWQLYPSISSFMSEHGFPRGSFHMKFLRVADHLVRRLFFLKRRTKLLVMQGLLQACPQRRFVLVGDSGEMDPEIYGSITRDFASQIAAVFIRDLDGRPLCDARLNKVCGHLPNQIFQRFRTPEELPGQLPMDN